MIPSPESIDQQRLWSWLTTLVWVGLVWHVVEFLVNVWLGVVASSSVLVATGLDAGTELAAGAILAVCLWRGATDERRYLRWVGYSFYAVGVVVAVGAIAQLLSSMEGEAVAHVVATSGGAMADGNDEAQRAANLGLALAGASIVLMYPLAWMKLQVSRRVAMRTAAAEAHQTFLCAHLSWLVVIGLVGAQLGAAWLDPACALALAALAVREGRRFVADSGCGCHRLPSRDERGDDGWWLSRVPAGLRGVVAARWPLTMGYVAVYVLAAIAGLEIVCAVLLIAAPFFVLGVAAGCWLRVRAQRGTVLASWRRLVRPPVSQPVAAHHACVR